MMRSSSLFQLATLHVLRMVHHHCTAQASKTSFDLANLAC